MHFAYFLCMPNFNTLFILTLVFTCLWLHMPPTTALSILFYLALEIFFEVVSALIKETFGDSLFYFLRLFNRRLTYM